MATELTPAVDGIAHAVLHQDARERVTYSHLDAGVELNASDAGGIELLVIGGSLQLGAETLAEGGWLRLPYGQRLWRKPGPMARGSGNIYHFRGNGQFAWWREIRGLCVGQICIARSDAIAGA